MAEKRGPLINARVHDLIGMTVRRVLPLASDETVLRDIGPFVFLGHMGPIGTKTPLFVSEHPHIGLATATYLFEGEILHHNSLGSKHVIRPGELNLMTAGRCHQRSRRAMVSGVLKSRDRGRHRHSTNPAGASS